MSLHRVYTQPTILYIYYIKNCTRSSCEQCEKSGDVGGDICGRKRRQEIKQDEDESHVTKKMKLLKI